MKGLRIITPVKDSIESSLRTIESVLQSNLGVPYKYIVYNDFSTPENTARLAEAAAQMGFTLVNLSDLTTHPSPNYLLVLRTAQREALEADEALCIVESDVTVNSDTLQRLYEGAAERDDCAIAASVTVDERGVINYPYGYARGWENRVVDVKKHCSSPRVSSRPTRLTNSTKPKTGTTSPSRTRPCVMASATTSSPACPWCTVRTRADPGSNSNTKIR